MTTYQWIRSRTYIFNKIYSVMCRYINNQEMVFFIRFEKKCFACCFDMSQTILLNLIKESQFTFYGLLSPICFLDYRKCACYLFSGHGRISKLCFGYADINFQFALQYYVISGLQVFIKIYLYIS